MFNGIVSFAVDGAAALPDDIQFMLREAFPGATFHELISWAMVEGRDPKKAVALLIQTDPMPEYGWRLDMYGTAKGPYLAMWGGPKIMIHSINYKTPDKLEEWIEQVKPQPQEDSGSPDL